jgi:hypothetical protein
MTLSATTRRAIVRAAAAWLLLVGTCAPSLAQRARRPSSRGASNASQRPAARQTVPPAYRAALDQIRPESLRAHLSFLASDALEGRATPSRGLDVAAEYIAAQFRRAGLAPAGDDGYFQTADWTTAGREPDYRLDIQTAAGGVGFGPQRSTLGVSAGGLTLWAPDPGLALERAGVVKLPYGDAAALSALTREQVGGRVIVTEMPSHLGQGRERAFALLRERHDFLTRLRALGALLVVSFDRAGERGRGAPAPRLVDPENPPRAASPFGGEAAPLVTVHGAEAAKFYDALPAGATSATLTFRAPAEVNTPVKVRNVAGLLRGSDPKLRDEYVVVSAHYDHIGVKPDCKAGEDCVYNGANDNASGTAGVIELASALSALKVKPKRSVLFLTFFGEERGLLGSRYYGRRPLVPLAATVAQINLEQVGRTDDTEGPQVSSYALTGFDFSDVGAALQAAGAGMGVRVFKHPTNSDAFFSRSDNQALADLGVPAHTASTAYHFPDYHGVGDEWEKVDYANTARVLRAVGLGVLRIADAAERPRWDESNPKTARYVEAWRKLRGPDLSREGNDE